MKKNNRSQITIFVVIALIIVVVIVLVFMLIRSQTKTITVNAVENPQMYIENCIKNNLEPIEKTLINNNFYSKLDTNFMIYYGKKVPFLCKSSQFYLPCMNQEPSLTGHLRNEVKSNLEAEKCFIDLIKELKSKGYDITEGKLNYSIEFDDLGISINMNKKIVMKKKDETQVYDRFQIKMDSPIYKLASTATSIVGYESTYCAFNSDRWMGAYKDIKITKFVTGDGTKVYILLDEKSEREVKFAVSSCVLPAGL